MGRRMPRMHGVASDCLGLVQGLTAKKPGIWLDGDVRRPDRGSAPKTLTLTQYTLTHVRLDNHFLFNAAGKPKPAPPLLDKEMGLRYSEGFGFFP